MNTVTTTTPTGVKHEVTRGEISLDRIYANEYQKPGTMTAQIRQVLHKVSTYPSKKTETTVQANIFDNDEFGFEGKEFTSDETRVAWLLVPATTTAEEVAKRIATHFANGATIYRVLSNAPILDENQIYAIKAGITTQDVFANSQVVRYPDTHTLKGQIWKDEKGNVQYRKTYFWKTYLEDQDLRGKSAPYISPEIKAELEGASVMTGQTI